MDLAPGRLPNISYAKDAQTVAVNLPKDDDAKFIMVVLSHSDPGTGIDRNTVLENETSGDLGAAWLKAHSAGSGAFVLTEWKSNEYVILTRNDD